MNRFLTLEEEIQRIKEIDKKSIIIEGRLFKSLPENYKTLKVFRSSELATIIYYLFDSSYESCDSLFYELLKFFGYDEDRTPSSEPTYLDNILPIALRTQTTFTRKELYHLLLMLSHRGYLECQSAINRIIIELNLSKDEVEEINDPNIKTGQEIITSDKESPAPTGELDEIIRCRKKGNCTLYSHKGKALGHGSKGEMVHREKQVNYFKHLNK
jgi:hypothetical protein